MLHMILLCGAYVAQIATYVSKFGCSLHKRKERENEKKHVITTGMTYNDVANDVILVYLLLTSNTLHRLFWCFPCWLSTSKYRLSELKQVKQRYILLQSVHVRVIFDNTAFYVSILCVIYLSVMWSVPLCFNLIFHHLL